MPRAGARTTMEHEQAIQDALVAVRNGPFTSIWYAAIELNFPDSTLYDCAKSVS